MPAIVPAVMHRGSAADGAGDLRSSGRGGGIPMKRSALLLFLVLIAFAGGAAAASNLASLGVGHGIVLPHPGDTSPCPGFPLLLNADGSYENGYAWQYGGETPPYFGAFAEGYPQ